ncbi:AMP-binding protein [Pseudovibrio sp. JE062]|uniref:AMP-binding protein n=1 Tax=Pseudovibrio sp. JE062 TaxID=439495 RepID=UPI000186C34B|nr:AMP-binding protein [Pseudovibrio sp. JE062]EEA92951.1 AMP-dependent synthetase and ligase [Pseudovibrio sp. JE062]
MSFIKECAELFSSRTLVVDDNGNKLLYADILDAAKKWESELGSDKQLVFLLVENTASSLLSYLGLTCAGHAVLLLSAELGSDTLEYLCDCYQPNIVVRPSTADGSFVISRHETARTGLHPELSVLLSTSGSTGSPKLVRFDGKRLEQNARSIVSYLELTSDERPFCHLPFHYSFGLSVVHSHLVVGATLLFTKYSAMEKGFWTRMDGATSFAGVPFHFEILKQLRFGRRAPKSIKTLMQAGGKLHPDLVEFFADLSAENGWRFLVMYGQTEAGPRISWLPHHMVKAKPNSIGLPIPNVTMSLQSHDGELIMDHDKEGELVIESPSVMLGYATCSDDLALSDCLEGKLRTGDLAKRDADGCYYITGRKQRFIKIHGNRVSLDDVESTLKRAGEDCRCVGLDDQLFIMVTGENVNVERVKQMATAAFTFPPRAISVLAIQAWPFTKNEKIDYGQLLKMAQQG